MTLYGDYLREGHRRIHKWYQYFPVYEKHFERFRNRHVTVFEIGVGEGGSLDQWRGYLGPFAIIVGIDIYPRCKQLEAAGGGQIHIRIGSQTDVEFLGAIVQEFGPPDIVIDDGSHLQHHVNATFDYLYPHVAKNGVYLVEDLHAAYWPDHGGGLLRPGSFIETAKSFVDKIHASHIPGPSIATQAGDRTTSVHFYDSVVVFEVGEARKMGNAMTGEAARFDGGWAPEGTSRDDFARFVDDSLKGLETSGPQWEVETTPVDRDTYIRALEKEVRLLRSPTSRKVTAPFRSVGRLFGRGSF